VQWKGVLRPLPGLRRLRVPASQQVGAKKTARVMMSTSGRALTRRDFLQHSLRGIGLGAVVGSLIKSIPCSARENGSSAPNRFSYDVERFAQTDPKLLKYDLVKTIRGISPQSHRIGIGPEHQIHIAARQGVQVMDLEGNELKLIRTGEPCRCVIVAPDKTIYAGSRTRIEVFDGTGRAMGSWEVPGPKTWLTALAVSENCVYAADSGNRAILRYDRTGKLLGKIGQKDPQRNIAGFVVPSPYLDVKLGREGLLWVNNPGRHRVDVFTPEGDLEFSWGKPSAAIEGFCGCCNPIGLALMPDDRCVTCEKGLPRVKIFSPERTLEAVVAGPELFSQNSSSHGLDEMADGTMGGLDAAVGPSGNIFILDLGAASVRVMRPKA
jgi:hypothetical protein